MLRLPHGDFHKFDIVRSGTEAMRALRVDNPITAAGDFGSVTIWHQPDGNLRGEFHQHLVLKDALVTPKKTEMRRWATKMIHRCYWEVVA